MATKIYKGVDVTLSTSEVAYELAGSFDKPTTTLTIVLKSGTMQQTVADASVAPILDSTYETFSTAGDKVITSMSPGADTLRMRCASAGVVIVNW